MQREVFANDHQAMMRGIYPSREDNVCVFIFSNDVLATI